MPIRLKEYPEPATEWIDSTLVQTIRQLGQEPALDKLRVTEAMHYGWRYREEEGVPPERYLGALQTSAWFTVDSAAMNGVMHGADPYLDDLPPLPFSRIALDARRNGKPGPLFGFKLVPKDEENDRFEPVPELVGREDEVIPTDHAFALSSMVLFEVVQGRLWDAMVNVVHLREDDHMGEETRWGFHITPGGHTADYQTLRTLLGWTDAHVAWDEAFGQSVWKCAVSAAHMITATNVRLRRILPHRKQIRDWGRQRYRPIEPRIYVVHIESKKLVAAPGVSDREYHCRWMVRGHYRHTAHGEFLHPVDGQPASWVRAHVKGPAGAPWKGRPNYVKEGVS